MLRPSSHSQRLFWAAAFALLLAMRLLTPTGFMPAWSGNSLQIVPCDEASVQVAAAMHHGGHAQHDKAKHRQLCPYGAASAQAFASPPAITGEQPPALASIAPAGTVSGRLALVRKIERPPCRAPPALG